MKYKNYYEILGLRGPRASDDEIKSAFRKLAKRYHPDQNPQYEDKFKAINEAYQTLGTPRLRKRYNVRYYFHIFQNGVDLSGVKESIDNIGSSEFVKIFIGEYFDKSKLNQNSNKYDIEVTTKITLEEAFNGVSKQIAYKIGKENNSIWVKIPKGANNGSKIVQKGEGDVNKLNLEKGDLIVKTEIIPDDRFEIQGNNLLKKVIISPSDAALGAELSVESIDGTYKLKVPVGAQNNDILSIKDAGFISKDGKRGDLLAKLSIEVPKSLSNEEKELYNKLKALQK